MSRILLVDETLKTETVRVPQSDVASLLGGRVTFVGAVPEVGGVIVARRDGEGDAHSWCGTKRFFDDAPPVYGRVAIVASGERGEEMDLDVEQTRSLLALTPCKPSSSC